MASQVLSNFEIESSRSYMLRDIFAIPELAPPDSESSANNGSCLRGLFVALGLEAAAAVFIYGICHAAQILR